MANVGRNRTTKSRKIRTLGEKETSKYLEILEADAVKQVKTKGKKIKSLWKRENDLKPNYIVEISSKDKHLGCPPRKILRTILKVDERKKFSK